MGGCSEYLPDQIIPVPPKPPINPNSTETIEETISTPNNPIQKEKEHIYIEFQFKTKIKDLKSINIIPKYTGRKLKNGGKTAINHYKNKIMKFFSLQ